ncbi:hypothetical protein [Stagnihabitans tardus]|uniref:Uncharacterized protein n=1 Tax=Stagnihabitans tardus TaxID=2699202 RepID=A0AAE4YA38_9RHOB|nr:hypothetical protein [Stagnihabitans tardus]NBZ87656.1 hypothetical protein [Stagnihabitans tardus]
MRLSLALLLALASPALAEGPVVTGGLSLSLTTEDDPGARQSAGAYVEAEFSGLYAGLSYDIYKDNLLNEADLYVGYRNTFGTLDVDAAYTRYIYPRDGGDCCGSLDLTLGLPLAGFDTALEVSHDPDLKLTTQEATLSRDFTLADRVTLTPSFTVNHAPGDYSTEWELQADYAIGTASTLSGYVADGSDYAPYLGVDLTWDVTLLGG